IFPFVSIGSEYAGQLTGFDTHGSDFTYLVTDAAPFTLTVLLGIPLLRSAAAETRPWAARIKLGAHSPWLSPPSSRLPVTTMKWDVFWSRGVRRCGLRRCPWTVGAATICSSVPVSCSSPTVHSPAPMLRAWALLWSSACYWRFSPTGPERYGQT